MGIFVVVCLSVLVIVEVVWLTQAQRRHAFRAACAKRLGGRISQKEYEDALIVFEGGGGLWVREDGRDVSLRAFWPANEVFEGVSISCERGVCEVCFEHGAQLRVPASLFDGQEDGALIRAGAQVRDVAWRCVYKGEAAEWSVEGLTANDDAHVEAVCAWLNRHKRLALSVERLFLSDEGMARLEAWVLDAQLGAAQRELALLGLLLTAQGAARGDALLDVLIAREDWWLVLSLVDDAWLARLGGVHGEQLLRGCERLEGARHEAQVARLAPYVQADVLRHGAWSMRTRWALSRQLLHDGRLTVDALAASLEPAIAGLTEAELAQVLAVIVARRGEAWGPVLALTRHVVMGRVVLADFIHAVQLCSLDVARDVLFDASMCKALVAAMRQANGVQLRQLSALLLRGEEVALAVVREVLAQDGAMREEVRAACLEVLKRLQRAVGAPVARGELSLVDGQSDDGALTVAEVGGAGALTQLGQEAERFFN